MTSSRCGFFFGDPGRALGLRLPPSDANNLIVRFLRQIGDASYTIYLSPTFVIGVMTTIWAKLGFTPGPAFTLGVVFPVVVVASLVA